MTRLRLGLLAATGVLLACPFDTALREYLHAQFWQPFSSWYSSPPRRTGRDLSKPYAGMLRSTPETPLGRLRLAYITQQPNASAKALAEARAAGLTGRDQEEVDLVAAKLNMRFGDAKPQSVRKQFTDFLRTAKTPEFRSEARGWIAHVYYEEGNHTEAGKIYIDELKRNDSNLSRDVLMDSLRMNFGHAGGQHLRDHIEEYFDTADHAVFAIQLVTNPRFNRPYSLAPDEDRYDHREPEPTIPQEKILALLEKHAKLLVSRRGSSELAILAMRAALRAGDPSGALRFAKRIPADSKTRLEPEFLWLLGSAQFLAKEYKAAEEPLVALFGLRAASPNQRAAAAYGLCGVYWKLRDPVEGLRFALWLEQENLAGRGGGRDTPRVENGSIYWASSGFDLGLLLEHEASISQLQEFVAKYPKAAEISVVKYALAVRLMRENRAEEAAGVYRAIGANVRAERALRVANLYRAAEGGDPEASIQFAAFLNEHSERVYFNDRLWNGFQSYVMLADADYRFTKEERERQRAAERKFKDDQEERWRAHLILRDVVNGSAPVAVKRRAAALDLECLMRLSSRFGRAEEIRTAIVEMRTWLRKSWAK